MNISYRIITHPRGSQSTMLWNDSTAEPLTDLRGDHQISTQMIIDYLTEKPFPKDSNYTEEEFLNDITYAGTIILETTDDMIIEYVLEMLNFIINKIIETPPETSPQLQNVELSSSPKEAKICAQCFTYDADLSVCDNSTKEIQNETKGLYDTCEKWISNKPRCAICPQSEEIDETNTFQCVNEASSHFGEIRPENEICENFSSET